MRRKRRVRLHLDDRLTTLEGFLVGGRWGGHYVLRVPQMLEAEDATVALDGHVEVPRERVLFYQVIS